MCLIFSLEKQKKKKSKQHRRRNTMTMIATRFLRDDLNFVFFFFIFFFLFFFSLLYFFQSINRSINQSISKSVNQSINQSISKVRVVFSLSFKYLKRQFLFFTNRVFQTSSRWIIIRRTSSRNTGVEGGDMMRVMFCCYR